jgi:NhaC family Na+:H+ antiporter
MTDRKQEPPEPEKRDGETGAGERPDIYAGRPVGAGWAILSVLCLIGLLATNILLLDGSGHIPLILSAAIAGLVARFHGWKWPALQSGILRAISLAMGAILILLVIGALMGTWLAAGIVPALIDWGLWLLTPKIFLPASCAVCAVVSLVSGSSWSTAGTIGLALIGVGGAMDINPAMTAGAVISGAYFGDKLSPMSDTTNLAPAMAGTDLFTHIRHMLWTTGPAMVLALIGYTVVGLTLDGSGDASKIERIRSALDILFDPGLVHLIAPLVVGVMVFKKAPALPTLLLGAIVGALVAIFYEGMAVGRVIDIAMSGMETHTGIGEIDDLLSRGGIASMSNTVLLILAAMVFGGIMERTGQLRVLAQGLLSLADSSGFLIFSTILTAIAVNILAADQYIAVVVPGRMYAQAYADRGLHPKNLSRALEDGGTITSPLVPWNTCGAFMASTLGVATGAYLPWCFLNLLNPIIGMIYGFTGWTIEKAELKSSDPEAPVTNDEGESRSPPLASNSSGRD